MTLEKNVNRMFWRLSSGKFTPNDTDVKAFKEIVEWINREKSQTLHKQQLFAKLYVDRFLSDVLRFEDFEFAQYSTNSVLNKPLNMLFEEFQERINLMELIKYCNQKDISLDITDEVQIEKISNEEDFLKMTKGRWTFEQVEKSLSNQITESINKYKNLQ
jgi:hypothetical protein